MAIAASYGGRVEGQFFPVVSMAQIDNAEQASSVSTRIWGRFHRLRDCTFEGLHFYVGVPGAAARAGLRFEEPSQVREPGSAEFGPWVVQLTPTQLERGSYAVAYHRCHPFWVTETRFW